MQEGRRLEEEGVFHRKATNSAVELEGIELSL